MTLAAPARIDRSDVERLVRAALLKVRGRGEVAPSEPYRPRLVANISARHVHVTQADLERLYGPGHRLKVQKPLYQVGEFAAEETVTVIGPRQRMIPGVRILGPCRDYTQVELAYTDGISLGIDLPLRRSGDHRETPGCWLMGPAGMIELQSGVIRAERHVHMSPQDAAFYGVKHGDRLHLRVTSACPVVLENLLCRVDEKYKLEIHIDTDEGNACDLPNAKRIELLKP